MDQKLDKILEEINELKTLVEDTRQRLDPVDKKISKLEERQDEEEGKTYEMRCQIAWLEQYGMENDDIINGLKEEKGEEGENDQGSSRIDRNRATKNAVINLAKKLGVEIDMKDIAVAHRIGNRKNKDAEEKRVLNIIA